MNGNKLNLLINLNTYKIGIIGEGSWATVIAHIINSKKIPFNWFIQFKNIEIELKSNKRNPLYQSNLIFDNSLINYYDNLNDFFNNSDIIFLILPAVFTEQLLKNFPLDCSNKIFISGIKGILPLINLTVSQYLNKYLKVPYSNIVFFSGPSHAEELSQKKLTFLTFFSHNHSLSLSISSLLETEFLKTNISNDILGAEFTTILKNIISIAVGIVHSLGYGDNFIAVLICKALKEIKNFLNIVAPNNERDLLDYPYLGDLLVTCYSEHSRNRKFGKLLGKGLSLNEIKKNLSSEKSNNMIAEGYFSVKSIIEISKKLSINLPICNFVYSLIYDKKNSYISKKIIENSLIFT